jgi:hypothetical protein
VAGFLDYMGKHDCRAIETRPRRDRRDGARLLKPNDLDCVLLQGPAYNDTSPAAIELEQGLPFLSLQIVRQAAFDYLVGSFFGANRIGTAKGVVEIVL